MMFNTYYHTCSPCGNYGSCEDDGILSYKCACALDWAGVHCTNSVLATEYLCEQTEAYSLTVPDEATAANILLQGGDGGWSYETRSHNYATKAGYGGITEVTFDVNGGELTLYVGCNGARGPDAYRYAGGGGGSSAVLYNDKLMAVAGGGGGASGVRDSHPDGGHGGGGGSTSVSIVP